MADIALQSLPSSGQAQSTNITPLTLASRNPTLESNRPAVDGSNSQVRSFLTIQSRNLHRWFKTQFRQSDVFLDSTEKLITEKIADLYQDLSPGWWSQIRKLEYLLSDYSDIKNKPGHDVALDLVQTWLFEDGTDAADIKSISSWQQCQTDHATDEARSRRCFLRAAHNDFLQAYRQLVGSFV